MTERDRGAEDRRTTSGHGRGPAPAAPEAGSRRPVDVVVADPPEVAAPPAVPDERFRLIADAAPVLIWTSDASGACDWCNAGWLAFTGRTLDEERGDGWIEGVHPDDIDATVAAFRAAVARREPYEVEFRLRHHDGTYRWVLDRGLPRWGPDGRFEGFVGSCVDIDDRQRLDEERQRLLAEEQAARAAAQQVSARLAQLQVITAELAAATDTGAVWDVVVDHVLQASGADALSIARPHPDEPVLEVMLAHGYDPEVLGRWLRLPLEAEVPITDAFRSGRAVWCSHRSAIERRYPAIAADVRASGRHALAAVPLTVGRRTVGVLGMSFSDDRRFDAPERRFVAAIAAECAAALERVDIRDAERLARARLAFLFGATRGLAGLTEPAEVLRVATELASAALADVAVALTVEGHQLVVASATHLDPAADAGLAEHVGQPVGTVDGPTLAAVALRRQQDVTATEPTAADALLEGLAAARAVPLVVDGEVRAVVVLGWSAEPPPVLDDAVLASFSTRVTVALTVALRYTHERDTAVALQRAVMPSGTLRAPGWDVAARYLPADAAALIGGDWYDVQQLGNGCLAVSVGDVAGHGLAAATAMVDARNALRVYAAEHDDPAEAMRHTNAFLHGTGLVGPGGFATAQLAVVDPSTGALRWASAGHPPLVACLGGEVAEHVAPGVLLGPFVEGGHETRSLVLAPGDVVVLYTDGLVERPDELIDVGIGRLRGALADVATEPAEVIADALLARCTGERDRRDDTCLVVLRRLA